MIFIGTDIAILEGSFANYFKKLHKTFEFLLDLDQYYPENDQAELHTRMITNPFYASEPFETLQDAIDRFEEIFGCMKDENTRSERYGSFAKTLEY